MATSGSSDFTLNARAVITNALKKIGVYGPDETPSAADMEDGRVDLNLMLKSFQNKAPSLFRRSSGSVTLVANTTAYTLTPRPYRVISARYRNSAGTDLPLNLWTAEEYEDMPVKTSTGIPTAYFVDYQRDSVVMNIWQPMSAVTTETIRYTYQRRFEDIDALANDLDIPQENLELVIYNLADRMAPTFGKAGSDVHKIVNLMATKTMNEFLADDREGVVRFVPGG